jgi:diguanylate cyclase (GGDEF)-like protein
MTKNDLLVIFVVVANLLSVMVWWSAGSRMGLSRKAAGHWLLVPVAHGLALSLPLMETHLSGIWYRGAADALVVWGFIAMRRGLQWFLRRTRTDIEHQLLGFGLTAFCLGICMPMRWLDASVAASSAAVVWTALRTAMESHRSIRQEFGQAATWVVTAPMLAAAVMFLVRGLYPYLPGSPLHRALDANPDWRVWLVLYFLVLAIALNFVLGYIVVMRLVRKLQHLSQHDGLTGLLNRRAIEYLLDREAQRLQRFGQPFAVMLVDIDHFKRINDRLGHPAGDAVLASVARTLESQAREVDRVARFGGEEFCVLLPFTLHEGAQQAGERLREAVRRTPVPWSDETISVTVSVGVAPASDPTEPLLTLLNRADQALYRAKADGRDRVVMADPAPERDPLPSREL